MSKIILKKNSTDYPFLTMPNHYPADRVYLDGDTTKSVQDKVARKADLTNLDLTGTTNTTGSTIASGTYFYLNGVLVRAKTAIASGATFTLNTNYEVVTVTEQIRAESGRFSFQTSGYVNYFRFGKVAMLHIVRNEVPTNEEIGTLPVGFRPSETLRFRNYAGNGCAIVSSNGSVVLSDYESWCNTTCTYTTSL